MREIVEHLGYTPRTCTWELTLRCNLRCGHCGSRAGQARGAGELGRDEKLRVAGELAALGCRRLTLSGGEPTLSEDWEAVAAEATRLGVRVNMVTNGLVPARELVRRARNAGLVSVAVSLDGPRDVHDDIRGRRGLYDRALELMDEGARGGLPIGAITTITKRNFRRLREVAEVLSGRVYAWQLQLGAAMGSLSDRREQVAPEDLLTIVPEVSRLVAEAQVEIHVADNIGYYGPYEEVLRRKRQNPAGCWVGCYAGCRHIGIEADGGVKGCLSQQATSRTEGNLRRESLRGVWLRPGAFAATRAFSLDDLAGFCRHCEYAAVCRGGCLGMRICEGGRENPFCYHRVATLAERARPRGASAYVPMALVPAALAALFGASCQLESTDDYGMPLPEDYDAEAPDAGDASDARASDSDPDVIRILYGMPQPVDAMPPDVANVDAYGLPPPEEAGADVSNPDAYGFPLPDAAPDVAVDLYGLPAPDASRD